MAVFPLRESKFADGAAGSVATVVSRQARRVVSRFMQGRGHKQAMRWVRSLRTWLGPLDRAIGRKIAGNEDSKRPSRLPASGWPRSSHAVVGLARHRALRWARTDIRVNALCPGFIETAMPAPLVFSPEMKVSTAL